jgi:YidC/Oxa1 family membrane protein insertase
MIDFFLHNYKKLKFFYSTIKNIDKINSKIPDYIFYSENKSYLKYSYPFLKLLSEIYPNKVYYISSDKDDKILDLNIKNICIGSGFLRQYFFKVIKAKNFFLTTTDLGNNILKKNKNVKNYIYYFHSPVSTLKQYMNGAFDNYDTIICNGDYQVNELKKSETIRGTIKKNFIKSGYLYFDYLKERINKNVNSNEILIAPSWNINEINYMNRNLEELIEEILSRDFNVRFRHHPENIKRSNDFINQLKKKFYSKNFILDESVENKYAMEKAKCLITDNSGIAIEYLLLFRKPILYFDDIDKVHNKEFDKYNIKMIEDEVKDIFGYKFGKKEIKNIHSIINDSILNFKIKEKQIDEFINKNFYNFGSTAKYLKNYFSNY